MDSLMDKIGGNDKCPFYKKNLTACEVFFFV